MRRKLSSLFILMAIIMLLVIPVRAAEETKVFVPGNANLWVKSSDTYKSCAWQAYADASRRLQELAIDEEPGTWCVVCDIDETIVNNVQYQLELDVIDSGYSDPTWVAWTDRAAAEAVPGASEFCNLVRELGGKLVLITNRLGPTREGTIKNLESLGITYDILLLKDGPYEKDSSKAQRRDDVMNGTIKGLPDGESIPPLKILMLAGDQIGDLCDRKLGFEDIKNRFSMDYIILPNPMYGDWEMKPKFFIVQSGKEEEFDLGALAGQEFVVSMDSNPTTGFDWELGPLPEDSPVNLTNTVFILPNSDMVGAGGKRLFTFKAVKSGEVLLTFEYRRPWETDTEPAETKSIRVIVK